MDIIIPSIYELEPIHPREKYIYSGPLFWKGFEEKFDLDEKEIAKKAKNRKIVYLSFGGSIFNIEFYRKILDVIGKLDYFFVVSTGPNIDLENLTCNSENTVLYNFVPGLRMCRLADVIVNTGSHGTVMQSLTAGKPIICIPCNIDQSYFAYRVEELGIGLNINKTNLLKFAKRESYYKLNRDIGRKLGNALNKVLSDPKFSAQSNRISESIEKIGDAAVNICDYIENKYES